MQTQITGGKREHPGRLASVNRNRPVRLVTSLHSSPCSHAVQHSCRVIQSVPGELTWSSRKGQSRRLNNDTTALAYAGDFLIAVVVDAAEQPPSVWLEPARQAYWVDSSTRTLASAPERLTSEQQVTAQLAVLQKSLRQYYLHDIASYGVFILHRHSCAADGYFTGDCRLGIESAQGEIEWLGTPHRAERTATRTSGNTDIHQGNTDIHH